MISRFAILLVLVLLTSTPKAWSQELDFSHEVVPILTKHCIGCHGGKEAKGSFSLNTRQLLVDSGYIDLESPAESDLLLLVKSTDPDTQMPPKDKPRLNAMEIATLEKWITAKLPWEAGFSFAPEAYEPLLKPRQVELPAAVDGRDNAIDRILDHWLAEHQLPRPAPIDDATFLRRSYLDILGLLPEPETLKEFVADQTADKRQRKIRELLDDKIAYADHWLSFYNDLLRNDYSGTGFITGGRKQISSWLYTALVTNIPFDQFARELIAPPTPESQGYIDGIRWRGEVSAGQTVEIQFAQSIAQSFLGINMKCASCHDSFIDRWKLDEAYGLAAIYADQSMEIHRCDKPVGRKATASWLFPEIGQVDPSAPRKKRLEQLAELMTSKENGRFTRTIVNRLWYRLMGRGIVHPLDAMQTEPWNSDLLDFLAVYLAEKEFDVKEVLYLIATSQAYQSQSEVVSESQEEAYAYAGPRSRRLTAEQFVDAVWQITETAPTKFDAPVIRVENGDKLEAIAPVNANWIWGKTDDVPKAGETLVFRKSISLPSAPVRGGAIITCDNEFTLFINGKEIARGTEWTQLQSIPLNGMLKSGDNQIVVIGKNAGNGPNAAGLYFAAHLAFENAEPLVFTSDETWEWGRKVPSTKEGRLGAIGKDFAPVRIVEPVGAWTNQIDPQARQMFAQLSSGKMRMVRASLQKNNAFMRSLGRPFREQIVSMRPTELTTLEAIDLANEAEFATTIHQGAERLAKRFDGSSELVDYLFQFALARKPTAEETKLLLDGSSDGLKPDSVEDLLWAVLMLPEFWLVR